MIQSTTFRFFPFCILLVFITTSCQDQSKNVSLTEANTSIDVVNPLFSETVLIVLGTIQDAGSPQLGCQKVCCKDLWAHPDPNRKVVSLGLYDPAANKKYIFDATPDMPSQLDYFNQITQASQTIPDGIFLTHAHIGHYTGLMYLGKEVVNSSETSVFAMPRMKSFLETSGPWSQLVQNKNIELHPLKNDSTVILNPKLSVTPILVPHRDEYSETVGYYIEGPNKKALFIPDIDKWTKWDRNIVDEIKKVDIALLDGPFYSGQELNNRDMSEIPHPTIEESMALFKSLGPEDRSKVHFIHFNHTNPILQKESKEAIGIKQNGYNIATFGQIIKL